MTRIEELEDENFLLSEQLQSYLPLPEWGLSAYQMVIFKSLRTDRAATLETFNIALERTLGQESTPGSLKAHITMIRVKLSENQAPFKVIRKSGYGWFLVEQEEKEEER